MKGPYFSDLLGKTCPKPIMADSSIGQHVSHAVTYVTPGKCSFEVTQFQETGAFLNPLKFSPSPTLHPSQGAARLCFQACVGWLLSHLEVETGDQEETEDPRRGQPLSSCPGLPSSDSPTKRGTPGISTHTSWCLSLF